MAKAPADIRQKEFNRKFRGYDRAEVQQFLSAIASDLEMELQEKRKLLEKIQTLEGELGRFSSIQNVLQQTLMQAQETTAKTVEHARHEAELILRKAEASASEMRDKALSNVAQLKEQIVIFEAKKDAIVQRLRLVLNSELELIKTLESELEPPNGNQPRAFADTSEIEDIVKQLK
jgi:cell division initiation protein